MVAATPFLLFGDVVVAPPPSMMVLLLLLSTARFVPILAPAVDRDLAVGPRVDTSPVRTGVALAAVVAPSVVVAGSTVLIVATSSSPFGFVLGISFAGWTVVARTAAAAVVAAAAAGGGGGVGA